MATTTRGSLASTDGLSLAAYLRPRFACCTMASGSDGLIDTVPDFLPLASLFFLRSSNISTAF
jgi:hypothetical protein